ncbi:MAG TPA: PIN domain-containing protein [Acidobacteriaceae bacterium]|nr:PIN domain-containing protein [Acidobacteriaceae bacterium]
MTIHRAKANLSLLIQEVSEAGEVVLARGSKPVARLIPVGEVRGRRQPGSLKGRLILGPGFLDPLPSRELERWEQDGQVLLDTHALLWWLGDDPGLTRSAGRIITQTGNTVPVSAATAWEIATKVRRSKLPTAADPVADFARQMACEGFELLAISAEHGIRGGLLPGPIRIPSIAC